MTATTDTLPDDPGTLKAMLLAERARAERLEQIIKELQRHRFGRRAETLPEDQLLLGLEEVEQTAASTEAENEAVAPAERASHAAKRRINRGSLPAHLPRLEMVVDIDDHACPCCQGALHRIGEDVSERLDIVPAQFRVLVVRRPKYACRACENANDALRDSLQLRSFHELDAGCDLVFRKSGFQPGTQIIVARLGGDEFAIIQTAVKTVADVTELVARVFDAIRQPYECLGWFRRPRRRG